MNPKGAGCSKSKSQRCGNPSMVGGSCAINVDFEDSIRNIFPFTNRYGSKQIQWLGFLSFPDESVDTEKKTDNTPLTRNPQLQTNYIQKADKSYEYIPTNFICYFDMQRLTLSKADFSKNKVFGLNGPPLKKNFITINTGDQKKYEYIKLGVILRFTADGKYQLTDKKTPVICNKDNQQTREIERCLDRGNTKVKENSDDSKKTLEKSQISKGSSMNTKEGCTETLKEDEEEYEKMKFHSKTGIPTVLISPVLNDVIVTINDDNINFKEDINRPNNSIYKYISEEYKKKYIILGHVNTPMLDKLNFKRLDKNLLILIPGFGRSNYSHALMRQPVTSTCISTSKRRRKTKIEKISTKRKNRSPPAGMQNKNYFNKT